jgi:hypothetical protein
VTLARKAKEKVIDPSTGKPVRAPRVPLTDENKEEVIAERIRLGALLTNDNLPDTVKGEAAKLLGLGTTQLLRRIQRSAAR